MTAVIGSGLLAVTFLLLDKRDEKQEEITLGVIKTRTDELISMFDATQPP